MKGRGVGGRGGRFTVSSFALLHSYMHFLLVLTRSYPFLFGSGVSCIWLPKLLPLKVQVNATLSRGLVIIRNELRAGETMRCKVHKLPLHVRVPHLLNICCSCGSQLHIRASASAQVVPSPPSPVHNEPYEV